MWMKTRAGGVWEPGSTISDLRKRSVGLLLELMFTNCLPMMDYNLRLSSSPFPSIISWPYAGLRIALLLLIVTNLYLVLEFIFSNKFGLQYSKYPVISLI